MTSSSTAHLWLQNTHVASFSIALDFQFSKLSNFFLDHDTHGFLVFWAGQPGNGQRMELLWI